MPTVPRSRHFAAFAVVALLLLTGCGPPWRVIRASGPPSALAGQSLIGVSFDWSRALLGGQPEQMWLSTQPPDDQAAYMEVRNLIMQTYMVELTAQMRGRGVTIVPSSGAEPVQLVVQPLMLEMGYYRFVVSQDSRLDTALVFHVGGAPTDEIEVRTTAVANMRNGAILGRMSDCAQRTARLTTDFLRRAQ